MRSAPTEQASKLATMWGTHEHSILVLQGGGALGAYQAGVYEGLAEAGLAPDWVTGISIGAINSALIAGNPPQRRVQRLREFWERVSASSPVMLPSALDQWRPLMNRMSATSAAIFGVRGFFHPRPISPLLSPQGTVSALSFYDTAPLRKTLEELADFDLVNGGAVRLSLGAVNVRSGQPVYFDSRETTITAAHVLASGALPPGFPPVEIDGEMYWDGGVVSNSPLHYVLEDFRIDALVVQVDVFSGEGSLPKNMDQVLERAKDIQYASRRRFSTHQIKTVEGLRSTLAKVLEKLPHELHTDPDVQKLLTLSRRGALSLVHFVNRHDTHSSDFKDYEFSRATVSQLWQGGLDDVRRMLAEPEARVEYDLGHRVRSYELAEAQTSEDAK